MRSDTIFALYQEPVDDAECPSFLFGLFTSESNAQQASIVLLDKLGLADPNEIQIHELTLNERLWPDGYEFVIND